MGFEKIEKKLRRYGFIFAKVEVRDEKGAI